MSRHIKPILLQGVAMLGLGVLATGCASTATGVSQSKLNSISSAQTLSAQVSPGTVMAVVRYPAFIETAAQDKFYDAYGSKAIGGSISSYDASSPEVVAIADSMILKSNYYALSLFKELAERMPEHSVLLSPHSIKLDENGKLTSVPMTQAESLANVVSVDFAAYTFPDPKKMMQSEPLTFGDIVTPLVTVRTDSRASATTQGVLLTSRPMLRGAVANGRKTTAAGLVNIQNGRLETEVAELDFITYLNGTAPVQVVSQPISSRRSDNTLSVLPIEKIKLDGNALKSLNSDTQAGVVDPLEDKFSAGLANQIIAMINDTDVNKAAMLRRASAISQFDESLAALTLVGSSDADYVSRERYAERLLEAEQKYLSVQSLRLFDGVHNGEMGAQVRDMLQAEYDVLEKRRELARQQNIATGLTVLAAVAAGAAITQAGDSISTIGQQIAINTVLNTAIFAGHQAFSYKRRSDAIGSNYLNSIAPALDAQTSVSVDLIDSNETITAIRFEDLRAKLQTLYDEKQRSLDTIATRCGYTHSGTSKSGTWMGVCDGGLANGPGVGVLRNADGSAVEYYGYAQNGQPQGPGYMIVHELDSSYALEGQFQNGLADGVMRVSKSGKSDTNRLYSAGQDVGSAPSGQGVISPFDGQSIFSSGLTSLPALGAQARLAALTP